MSKRTANELPLSQSPSTPETDIRSSQSLWGSLKTTLQAYGITIAEVLDVMRSSVLPAMKKYIPKSPRMRMAASLLVALAILFAVKAIEWPNITKMISTLIWRMGRLASNAIRFVIKACIYTARELLFGNVLTKTLAFISAVSSIWYNRTRGRGADRRAFQESPPNSDFIDLKLSERRSPHISPIQAVITEGAAGAGDADQGNGLDDTRV